MADPAWRNTRLVPAPRDELCLAFANTRSWRGSAPATETLNGLGDVLAWCKRARSVDEGAASQLDAWARRHGNEAERLFAAAIAARETIYALFSASAANLPVSDHDIDTLNLLLAGAPPRSTLAIAKEGNLWRLPPAVADAASLLAPVLWSAGDLLASDRLGRVRLCANEKCRWLFLDDSKSGTRRWCAMSSCGNRAKAHRHYLRKISSATEPVG